MLAAVNFDTYRILQVGLCTWQPCRRGRIWCQIQHKHFESRLEVIQDHAFWDH